MVLRLLMHHLSFTPGTVVPVICSQPESSHFHLLSPKLSIFYLGLLVGEEMVILIWIYFISKSEYFYVFIDHLYFFGLSFCIPYSFFFIFINLQSLFALCDIYYKYFGHFIVTLSNLFRYFCLLTSVKFYSVKYFFIYFHGFVFAHMSRKILYNEDEIIMRCYYLFAFKSYKHLDLF